MAQVGSDLAEVRGECPKMTTHKHIGAYLLYNHSFIPKTYWIAHVKEISGLPLPRALNRRTEERREPCPPERVGPTGRRCGTSG